MGIKLCSTIIWTQQPLLKEDFSALTKSHSLGSSGTQGGHDSDIPGSHFSAEQHQVQLGHCLLFWVFCTVVSYYFPSDSVFYQRLIADQVKHCSGEYVQIAELQGSTRNKGRIWRLVWNCYLAAANKVIKWTRIQLTSQDQEKYKMPRRENFNREKCHKNQ